MTNKHTDKKATALAAVLRKVIRDSELSHYRIAKETGISQPIITRFVNGQRSVSLRTASLLIEYFGFELKAKE